MAPNWKSSYFRYRELFLNVSSLYKKRADLRAFLEIVLSITAVISFLMFAIKPTALTIISLVQQIKEEKQTLTSLTKKVNDLQQASSLLAQNQNYLEDINTAVPTAPNPEVFVKQLQALSSKHGVEFAGLSIDNITLVGGETKARPKAGPATLPENANGMNYTVSIRGGFTQINAFLKDLENLRIISVIDSTTINSSTTDTGGVIVAVIYGRVPYLGNTNSQ